MYMYINSINSAHKNDCGQGKTIGCNIFFLVERVGRFTILNENIEMLISSFMLYPIYSTSNML